jgi:hypothetical protein
LADPGVAGERASAERRARGAVVEVDEELAKGQFGEGNVSKGCPLKDY